MEESTVDAKVTLMESPDGLFVEYFHACAWETLTERQSKMIDMRYGFVGGESYTLERIAQEFGVTRERIRQLLVRSVRKIAYKAKRELRRGQRDKPCGCLSAYLEDNIGPGEPGEIDRAYRLIAEELSHLPINRIVIPLIISLICNAETAKSYSARLLEKNQEYLASIRDQMGKEQADKFGDCISAYIIWPKKMPTLEVQTTPDLNRRRDVSTTSKGYSGKFFSEKMGREVQYESHMECHFYLQLEQSSKVTIYQEQPFIIEYELDGEKRAYYPDVFFIYDGKGVIAEIKPRYQMALHENLRKWSALRVFCAQHGYGLLVTDGKRSIQQM